MLTRNAAQARTTRGRLLQRLLWPLALLALLLPSWTTAAEPTTLTSFSHTQQASGALEQQTRSVTVPSDLGPPYHLVLATREPLDRERVASLQILLNGTEVASAADLYRSFPEGGKKVQLRPGANTLTLAVAARAGVIVDVRLQATRGITPVDVGPTPVAVQRDATVTLRATLSPTPATDNGGIFVKSKQPLIASPAQQLVPYEIGQTTIDIPVHAHAEGDAEFVVAGGGGKNFVHVKVVSTPVAIGALLPAIAHIERGAATTLSVKLDSVRTTATTVALAAEPSGIVSLPGAVTVPAGALSASVNVATLAEGSAQISASVGDSSVTSSVTVKSSASVPVISLQPATASVTLGAATPLTVAIASAKSTPTTITLSSTPSGIVSVPTSVTIPAGQTSASFNATATALGHALERATLDTGSADSAITVVPPLPTIVSLKPATLDLVTGSHGSFTLALDAAQPRDTHVPVQAGNANLLSVPHHVSVPAGRNAVEFSVTGLYPGQTQITASLNGSTRSAGVTIGAATPAVAAIEPASFSVQAGATGSATVRLNAVQQHDTRVQLSVTPSGVLRTPASVIVSAGSLTATVPVTGLAEGTAQLSATLPGGAASASVSVTTPPVQISGLTPATLTLARGRTGTLRLAVSAAAAAPVVVTLSAGSGAITAPASITVPAGQLSVDIPVVAANVGSATLSASLNGSSASASVQVTPPEVQLLELSPPDASAFVGDTVQYRADATLTDGTTRNETAQASWASSNPVTASINSAASAQALAAGASDITATSGAVTSTTALTVLPTPVLTLSPASATLAASASQVFTVNSSVAAGSDGLTVTLAATGTGSITLPASVTIAAGQSSIGFSVTANTGGVVTLSASAPRRASASATLTITSSLSITGITPSSGPVGSQVTISGSGFDPNPANDRVAFTGPTSAGIVATVVSASATQLVVTVPAGAQSGPVTVTTPGGSATSPAFTVQGEQDFSISASPAESTLIVGTSTTLALQPASTGTRAYTGLIDIAVVNLPAGVTARLQPATLNASQNGAVVFSASATAAPGRYDVTVQASGLTSAGRQTRTATATLVVQATEGATGVKGRFITPDGRPVAGVLVRVDAIQTATDAAGNFLLTGLPAGPVTLRFDATPAHPLYPIWPYSMTLTSGQIAVIADWTINPPPADEAFVLIANATQTQRVTDARYPGFEITLPAGVSITGWDGVPKSRIAVQRIEVDKLPVPLPPVPIKETYQLYFGTPMGGIPSQPIPVTLPNVAELEPGEQSEIWFFDGSPMGGSGEWKLAGLGTISADGKTVVSNPGVGIPRFCGVCGLLCQNVTNPRPPPPQPPPTLPRACSPNPIDYYTGQEMPTNGGLTCQGLVPIDTGMNYNPVDAFNGVGGTFGSVGLGWTLDYDIVFLPFQGPQKRLVLPAGRFVNFVDDGSGIYRNSDSAMFDGALMRPYPQGGAGDWELVFKDGRIWRFKPFAGITGPIRGGLPLFMTEMVDPAGPTLSITRRSDGRLLAAGTQQRAVTAEYGANGFISRITDPENRSTGYTYTPDNRIATVTDPMGGVTRYTYVGDTEIAADAVCGAQPTMGERIKTITHPGRPNPTENFYGVGKRVIRQLAYDGQETRFAYKLAGACVTHTSNPGVRCSGPTCPDTDSWDNHQAGWRIHGGQVVATTMTRADGSTDTVRFGAAGAMLERQDASAQAKRYVRDAQARVIRETDALGRIMRKVYDAQGNVTRRFDALNRITDITYDTRWGKPTSITRYDADGSPVTTQVAYSGTTGKLIRSTDPLGNSTTYAYTPQGQLASVTDPLGNRSELTYNAAGDLIAEIDSLGNDKRSEHDRIGRLTHSTDPLGYSATFNYNVLGLPVQSTDPLGGATRYAYDAANRLTSVVNALNRTVESYGYDAGDRLTSRTDALGQSEAMTHDVLGRVASRTDRNGQLSRHSYDSESRLTRVERVDGTLTISYDAVGRVQRIEDTASGGSTLVYEYDSVDRLTRETQTSNAGSHVVVYEYDALDRRIRRTVNGADATAYGWDRASRLTTIGYAGHITSYAYDAAGRLTTRTLPNGIVQNHGYDNAGRLTSIAYTYPDGTPIETVNYSYDANGRRTSKTSASNSTAQETGFTATYNDADRMTAVTLSGTGAGGTDETCTLAYDSNGNLASRNCGGNSTTYSWDAQNRLTAISGPGVTASFGYDPLGRRVTRTVNGQTTTYVYDGAQAIAETRNGINATLLVGLQIDEVIARYATVGNRTMMTDALGSVIIETRDDRSFVARREYTPYGQSVSIGGASANDSHYTARENDGTSLYFYRARYYDPQLKRFVSQDPIGLNGGVNQYAYVKGDPVSRADPSGLETYICRRPLGGSPGSSAPPLLNHTYVCVGSGANMTCGSTTASSGGIVSNIISGSEGAPTSPAVDYYHPEACEQRHGEDSCIESCIANRLRQPTRPRYAVGPAGTDCQEYTEDVVSTCERRCVRR